MDQGRFDEISIAVSEGQTRRTALKWALGGSLGALAAASGAGLADEAAAKSCRRRCRKKSGNRRRKCHRRCSRFTLHQEGGAELLRYGPDNCAQLGKCIDLVLGTISGAPVIDGTFTGAMTGFNIHYNDDMTLLIADFAGTLIASETATNETIGAALTLLMEQEVTEQGEPAPFTFSGTFVIAGGTGKFAGATGGGTISGEGIRDFGGVVGTVDSFLMEGTFRLKNTKRK